MSFTTRSTFSTNYWSLGSVQAPSYGAWPVSSMASVYAGAEGSGSWIFVSRSTSFRGCMGSGGLAAGMAGDLAGMGSIQNEKETIQSLNDRLASYLDRARSLETENRKLESKIRKHLEKKGDWRHYFTTIEDLRAQIFANTVDNIDNARLAADNFRVKYEIELDIHGLHKVIDDTNLETEIEALKEELLFMKKNHEEEVKGLQDQIVSSGLTVGVDAPKSQDLAKIVADIQAQYDELARKKRQELDKYWSQQIEESTTVVTMQSTEVGTMEQLNGILLHLQSEVAQIRAEGQCQEALVNIKVKLEAEIATYCHLLEDGEDFSLGDALDSSNSMQTIQKTTTCQIMDGKVVSETNDTKVLRH
uniref:IF rod domain-containing protein n=1 Tax=Gorilla gorilla gorilla TaxID=9595 RepID=G3SE94_GORGO